MCSANFKKNELKPWRNKCWVIPPKENADCAMEDILKVYQQDYKEDEVLICMDETSKQQLGSLYSAFEPEEARRIAERLEIHYTPKHGSWLDMAEIEIGVLSRQCLNRRIPDQKTLRSEIEKWETKRNQENVRVNWRFTTEDARIKLKSLYPSIQG